MQNLNRRGQGLVEYILVVFLMAVLAIAAVKKLGTTTQSGFSKANTDLDKVFNGG